MSYQGNKRKVYFCLLIISIHLLIEFMFKTIKKDLNKKSYTNEF